MNEPNPLRSYIEPDAETVKRREIIIAMSDFMTQLGPAEGQSLAIKMDFPLQLLPMLTPFARGKIQMTEILQAWRNIPDKPGNQ